MVKKTKNQKAKKTIQKIHQQIKKWRIQDEKKRDEQIHIQKIPKKIKEWKKQKIKKSRRQNHEKNEDMNQFKQSNVCTLDVTCEPRTFGPKRHSSGDKSMTCYLVCAVTFPRVRPKQLKDLNNLKTWTTQRPKQL